MLVLVAPALLCLLAAPCGAVLGKYNSSAEPCSNEVITALRERMGPAAPKQAGVAAAAVEAGESWSRRMVQLLRHTPRQRTRRTHDEPVRLTIAVPQVGVATPPMARGMPRVKEGRRGRDTMARYKGRRRRTTVWTHHPPPVLHDMWRLRTGRRNNSTHAAAHTATHTATHTSPTAVHKMRVVSRLPLPLLLVLLLVLLVLQLRRRLSTAHLPTPLRVSACSHQAPPGARH